MDIKIPFIRLRAPELIDFFFLQLNTNLICNLISNRLFAQLINGIFNHLKLCLADAIHNFNSYYNNYTIIQIS